MNAPAATPPCITQSTLLPSSANAEKSQTKKRPFNGPQPPITKNHTFPRRRPSTDKQQILSTKQQAIELESKLESSLAVAAGGITTLTKNLVARQTSPKLVKDKLLSQYLARLRVINDELKGQLKTLGTSSKLSSQQDRKSFDLSYRGILALWKEYQRISACIVERARLHKRNRGNIPCDNGELSGSSTSISSASSAGTKLEQNAKQ